MEEKKQIGIATQVVFRTLLMLLAVWFLYMILDILALLFIAILIVAAIDPAVDWMQKKEKIPRWMGVVIIYVLLFAIISLSISFLIPPLASQFKDFSHNAALQQEFASTFGNLQNYLQAHDIRIGQQIFGTGGQLPEAIYSRTVGFFSGFLSFFAIFVMAFYMTLKEDGIKKFVASITPEKHRAYAASLTERIEEKIGRWVQGQLFLMVIIFVLDFAGLSLVGIPYALALALFAGLMEIIPYVGPVISAVPGIILGILISPVAGLLALLVYFLAQQIEAHIIVPQVMKKAVGLNPVAVILALLIGYQLGGVLGAILSIPLATMVSVFVADLMKK